MSAQQQGPLEAAAEEISKLTILDADTIALIIRRHLKRQRWTVIPKDDFISLVGPDGQIDWRYPGDSRILSLIADAHNLSLGIGSENP